MKTCTKCHRQHDTFFQMCEECRFRNQRYQAYHRHRHGAVTRSASSDEQRYAERIIRTLENASPSALSKRQLLIRCGITHQAPATQRSFTCAITRVMKLGVITRISPATYVFKKENTDD